MSESLIAITHSLCITGICHECITDGEKIHNVSYGPTQIRIRDESIFFRLFVSISVESSRSLLGIWVSIIFTYSWSFSFVLTFEPVRRRKKNSWRRAIWKKKINLLVSQMWKFWALSVSRCGFRAASTINRGNRMQFTLNGNGAIDWWFRTLARRFAMPLDCDLRKINNEWKAELRIIKKMQLAKSLSTVDQEWIGCVRWHWWWLFAYAILNSQNT